MDYFIYFLVIVGGLFLYSRLRHAEGRLHEEEENLARERALIGELTKRVWALECSRATPPPPIPVATLAPPVPAAAIVEPPAPRPSFFSELIEPPPVSVAPPPLVVAPRTPPAVPSPLSAESTTLYEPAAPQRSWRDQLRDSMDGEEWEAVVGGSWLNKLGVLVLVIGIALLLGYEFGRVGPLGRVATGFGVSLAMLLGGFFVERRRAYVIFARGLIGGGWAALYFTTFAMHALPAAKVIDNPYAATALLLAVAGGMILHSLRYKSQTVSGLAYFIAFATLALSESTPFSVLGLLPLAASLLYLAHRFEWHRMAVFGLFATYATCASRPDTGAPLASTQALFAMYWLLFETFDLLRIRRSRATWTIESLILPVNALGLLSLSIVKWQRLAPQHLYTFFAAAAAVYLASALLRASLRPPSEFGADSTTPGRIAGGSYEGPIALSTALAAAAILLRATGQWINLGLVIEAQILFLAGFQFQQKFLRQLAGAVFSGSLAKLALVDQPATTSISFAGHSWTNWSPVAALTAALFYVNRTLREPAGALYSSAAAALIAMLLGAETPPQYLCVAWLAFAAILFEVGLRLRRPEFRYQAYVVGALGTGAGLLLNALGVTALGAQADWQLTWLPLPICAAIHYAVSLRVALGARDRLGDVENNVSWISATSATAFLFAVAWKLAPSDYLGLAWLLLGAVLFELGLHKLPEHFRWLSYYVSAAGLANIFWLHVVQAQIGSSVSEAVSLGVATAVCWAVSARVSRSLPERIAELEREWCRDLYAAAGAVFAMTLAWLKLPPQAVAPVWAALGILALELGIRGALSRFRLLAHIVAAAVCVRLFVFEFAQFGDAFHLTWRTLTVTPILASFYFICWRCRRAPVVSEMERAFSRLYLYLAALLALVLARFELGESWAVVAWALFGLALYLFGQAFKIADLRRHSYAIALLSFWQCWIVNFSAADILVGVHARVLTGSVVIASFYCAQLLSPRDAGDSPLFERGARAFYSLLASLLLAILLFYEVSGGALTIVWGVEALALLAAGFPLRDRLQRLSGLALFMLCVFKLFLYDLRELGTVNRIMSFIVLGIILVGVSWIYTRFRGRIQRFL